MKTCILLGLSGTWLGATALDITHIHRAGMVRSRTVTWLCWLIELGSKQKLGEKQGRRSRSFPEGRTKCVGYLWVGETGALKKGGCSLAVISPQCLFHHSHQSKREEPGGRSVRAWSSWCEWERWICWWCWGWQRWRAGEWLQGGVFVKGRVGVHSAFLDQIQHGGHVSNHHHHEDSKQV